MLTFASSVLVFAAPAPFFCMDPYDPMCQELENLKLFKPSSSSNIPAKPLSPSLPDSNTTSQQHATDRPPDSCRDKNGAWVPISSGLCAKAKTL